jgi:hypothetical protein
MNVGEYNALDLVKGNTMEKTVTLKCKRKAIMYVNFD